MQKRILIFGLPGSGKSTLANKLTKKLDALHINADQVREKFNDWDFSDEGRLRQAYRMKEMSSDVDKQYVILDFVCPKKEYRKIISADISIFMDTIEKSRYKDTNSIFEIPKSDEKILYCFKEFNSDSQSQLITSKLLTFDWRKPTVQMLGRWQPFHDGHLELFKKAYAISNQVVIQIRDCQDWNDSNPFNFEYVKKNIVKKLSSNNFVMGKHYVIMLVPNIIDISYGRGVGYTFTEHNLGKEIHKISATKIRKKMGYKN